MFFKGLQVKHSILVEEDMINFIWYSLKYEYEMINNDWNRREKRGRAGWKGWMSAVAEVGSRAVSGSCDRWRSQVRMTRAETAYVLNKVLIYLCNVKAKEFYQLKLDSNIFFLNLAASLWLIFFFLNLILFNYPCCEIQCSDFWLGNFGYTCQKLMS